MTSELPTSSQHAAARDIGQSLWQNCIDQLAQELPEQQFNTWIKPLHAQVQDDFSRVTIFVANRFKLDWIRAQYSSRISSMLEKLYGQVVQVELAITPREIVARPQFAAAATESVVIEEAVEMGEDRALVPPKNRLNSMLTFETLVEGTAPPPCMWRPCRAICTTHCSFTAASAWARPI
jgi:chromosomal replication initiator protein